MRRQVKVQAVERRLEVGVAMAAPIVVLAVVGVEVASIEGAAERAQTTQQPVVRQISQRRQSEVEVKRKAAVVEAIEGGRQERTVAVELQCVERQQAD